MSCKNWMVTKCSLTVGGMPYNNFNTCNSECRYYEPKPEERSDEQIPAVVRSKWPNKLQLSKLNEHGIGRDIELMMSAGSDTIDMEINEQDHEDSHYLSICIDKEMAVKIINYLRNHYDI